jgi:undecaprenol kinase
MLFFRRTEPVGTRAAMKNQRFHQRLGFAVSGICAAWQREHSLRWHSVAALLVLLVLLWSRPAPLWWAVMGLTVASVLAAELFNTAIEQLLDHVHPGLHPSIKLVKDCAAGAVLLVSLGALCVAAAFVYSLWWS